MKNSCYAFKRVVRANWSKVNSTPVEKRSLTKNYEVYIIFVEKLSYKVHIIPVVKSSLTK